ncbi:type VI secretion system-associated protein TagF [uncultured Roseibium sp.]|uniref:type VI secretion system-associated protein TagF n=1 Tax=uncultured Roseibium sp. TaxID=1936171 RepID=UPI002619B142|nr:type VI secretion system-associated protein TagF [uncultured Roseibium sp.]
MTNTTGYFGKLPDRADFVIGRCPDGFSRVWEPFLMRGLSQSREDLGSNWEEAYMTMPVWRFLMRPGTDEAGIAQTICGAFMPSVDKVGRKFPLTIASSASGLNETGMPEEAWYDETEAILLSALDEEADLEGFQTAVSALGEPLIEQDTALPADGLVLEPGEGTAGKIDTAFWCRAGQGAYVFRCGGLPEQGSFQWLILPEAFEAADLSSEAAGQEHGRYHPEDHRT